MTLAFTFALPVLFSFFFALPLALIPSFTLPGGEGPVELGLHAPRLCDAELAGEGDVDRQLRRAPLLVQLHPAEAELGGDGRAWRGRRKSVDRHPEGAAGDEALVRIRTVEVGAPDPGADAPLRKLVQ